jgi:hypothetical protein
VAIEKIREVCVASKIRKQLKPNDERQLKKLTYQLKFLREELVDCNESFHIYQLELKDAVYSYLAELGQYNNDKNADASEASNEQSGLAVDAPDKHSPILEDTPDIGDDECKNTADPEIKKLFRKIVTLTHPDKVLHMTGLSEEEKHDRFQIYRQACKAFENNIIDDIIELAIYLGIDVNIPIAAKIGKIKSQIKKAEQELTGIRQAVEWIWGINFGDNNLRARILVAVCNNLGAKGIKEDITIQFINRYDSDTYRAGRRKIGERPKRKVGERPKRPDEDV